MDKIEKEIYRVASKVRDVGSASSFLRMAYSHGAIKTFNQLLQIEKIMEAIKKIDSTEQIELRHLSEAVQYESFSGLNKIIRETDYQDVRDRAKLVKQNLEK